MPLCLCGESLLLLTRVTAAVVTATLLSALIWSAAFAQSREEVAEVAPFSPAPYRVGERLTYNVSFANFPTAAHVRLEVAERGQFYGREGVELRAHVETLGIVSAALYALNNEYVTWIEPSTGLPFRSQQNIREGGRVQDLTSDYNAPAGASAIPPKRNSASIPGSFDLLSALYRARALPLAQGMTYPITIQQGGSVYSAELRVVGRETLKTDVGTTAAIVTRIRVPSDSAADAYQVRVYFSDDERHVPVLVTARHRAGEIRAALASAEFVTPAVPAPGGLASSGTPLPPAGVIPDQPTAKPPDASSSAPSASAPGDAAPADLPFKPGDQLNYTFFLGPNPQPIGTGSFQVRDRARYFGRDGLLFASVLQTTGAGQTLFPVNNQISSYVDAKTLLPFRTELSLSEGNRRASFTVSTDQQGGTALFADGTRVEIPFGTHDLVSVFYALRSFDLTPPKRTSVSLLVNKRPRQLSVTALRRGPLILGGEQIEAVELSLATSDPDGDRFKLRMWVSADRRRLPLRVTAETPLGLVRADLAIIPTRLQ